MLMVTESIKLLGSGVKLQDALGLSFGQVQK